MLRWIVLVPIVAAEARADSWASPTTETVASKSGAFVATITPGPLGGGKAKPATIKLATKNGTTVYERAAVNRVAPVDVLVSDRGHVVTVGEWHNFGYDHALVIYGPKGDLVMDRRLEELLLPEEHAKIEHSISSRWWIKRDGKVSIDGDMVVVPGIWGGELRWRLADGARLRANKPSPIPSDEERFTGYVTGKRAWTSASITLGEADDEDGGVSCRITATESKCEPFGKTSRPQTTTKVTPKAFAVALKATPSFATLVNTQSRGALPEPHWFITLDFEEVGIRYDYKVLIAKRQLPKDYAVAIGALRKLAGL